MMLLFKVSYPHFKVSRLKLGDNIVDNFETIIIYSPHVIQDAYVFLSSVEKKWRFLMETFHKL